MELSDEERREEYLKVQDAYNHLKVMKDPALPTPQTYKEEPNTDRPEFKRSFQILGFVVGFDKVSASDSCSSLISQS